ncbi:MAG TPA: L,D-transpeptidase [Kofleriaceae bacterium]|jgi:hypothetical protein
MRAAWVLLVLAACGGKKEPPPPTSQPTIGDESQTPAPTIAGTNAPAPAFPTWARSLELKRTVGVRLEPKPDAKRIGDISIDTRVRWQRTEKAKGCTSVWVELAPRGWVCGDYVAPSKLPPYGQEVPRLDKGELVPGTYGKVTGASAVTYKIEKPVPPKKKKGKPVTTPSEVAPPVDKMVEDKPIVGSVNVRDYEDVSIGGKSYWKIDAKQNEYVLASAITPHRPSAFGGTRLGDDTGWGVPFAFVWPRPGMGLAYTTNKAAGGGIARQLAPRTPAPILETVTDKAGKPTAYRIGDGEWLQAADARVFHPAPPPAHLGKGERWIDVDVDSQILVAYEGELPVYATMVTTGAVKTPTDTGVYRMWMKESEADMNGLNGEDPYSVATVPWTQFFSPEKGLALHTAYWHDAFGTRRSHGCVNLAPKDARWLYFWSDPQVPPGWTMAAGVVEAPGSIVRVRSKDDPDPPLKGYARSVEELRASAGT